MQDLIMIHAGNPENSTQENNEPQLATATM